MLKKGFQLLQQMKKTLTGPLTDCPETASSVQSGIRERQAAMVLQALGGKENVATLDACATRLRVTVRNPGCVDQAAVKQLGAAAILVTGYNLQAVFGSQAAILCRQLTDMMGAGRAPHSFKAPYAIYAPLSGEVVDLAAVPDQVFAERMMGDGFAIKPTDGLVLSPAAGKIATAFSTRHAIALVTAEGLEILIHVGIDTVKLRGAGFELLIQEGDAVAAGTPLLKVDLAYINRHAKSSLTPVIFTNLKGRILTVNATEVVAGQSIVCTVQSG